MLKRPILLILLVAMLLCVTTVAVSAAKVTNGPLNVRAEATTDSALLGSLETGTEVTVLETKAVGDYTWGRFLYNGASAWIRLDYTDFDVTVVKTVTVISGPLNVRSESNTDSSVVGSLEEGVSVTVLETRQIDSYTWGRITLAGDETGWIRLDFTDYDGGEVTPPEEEPEPTPTVRRDWVLEGGKWYYYIDGVKTTGWQIDRGQWYFMDGTGVMQTGWLYISGTWYYLKPSGAMVTGWQTIGNSLYYFNASGKMLTGWQQLGTRWYYFSSGGAAAIGWKDLEGNRYYFDKNGAMATGKYRIDGVGYLFDEKGILQGLAQFTGDDCLALIKLEEGFSAKPYWDYTQWTVGYGSKCPDDKLSYYNTYGIPEEEAEALLRENLDLIEKDVDSFITRYGLTLNQNQYDALVIFSYNVGSGWTWETEGIFHNAIKDGATGNELIRAFSIWNSAGGTFKDFLMRRRLSEANIYLNGVYSMDPPVNYCYVRYDANGGDVSPKAQGYDSNVPAKPMSTPTYSGKTFKGWYTAKTGGTLVTELDASCKGMTLYARWEDPNGGNEPEDPAVADRPIIVTVNTESVNLRKGPGTEYDRLDTKPQAQAGEQYTILKTYQGDTLLWGCFTEYGGGWICLSYTDYETALKTQSATNSWIQLDGKWYYYKGLYKHTGWLQMGDVWYYLDGSGVRQTGWLKLGNTWYYMKEDGVMVTGTVTIDGKKHSFHTSGAWLGEVVPNGWIREGNDWYYYKSGTKQTGWLHQGGVWYYLKTDGAMQTGWLKLGSTWYYLKPSGAMQTGWLKWGSKWCYFESSGAMVTGEKRIGPVTYYFDENGYWIG